MQERGKSVLVKESKLPKLVKGQKFESWCKEVDYWKREMVGNRQGDATGLEEYCENV